MRKRPLFAFWEIFFLSFLLIVLAALAPLGKKGAGLSSNQIHKSVSCISYYNCLNGGDYIFFTIKRNGTERYSLPQLRREPKISNWGIFLGF